MLLGLTGRTPTAALAKGRTRLVDTGFSRRSSECRVGHCPPARAGRGASQTSEQLGFLGREFFVGHDACIS